MQQRWSGLCLTHLAITHPLSVEVSLSNTNTSAPLAGPECHAAHLLILENLHKYSIKRYSWIILIRKWSALKCELLLGYICSKAELKGRNNYILKGKGFWPKITLSDYNKQSYVVNSESGREIEAEAFMAVPSSWVLICCCAVTICSSWKRNSNSLDSNGSSPPESLGTGTSPKKKHRLQSSVPKV